MMPFYNDTRRRVAICLAPVLALIAGILLLAGCVHRVDEQDLDEWVAPSADRVWVPPSDAVPAPLPAAKSSDIPDELLKSGRKWRLLDIIEIALRNNPQTRAAWFAARSAAADWRSQQGDYYPQIDAGVGVLHSETINPGKTQESSINTFQPGLQLNWLIFDFGGRPAAVDEKRQALLAANFTHNAAVQDTVLLVLQTYFQYANATVLVKSLQTSLDEAATNLEAARQRHQDGLATIADVLQAQTALSQARLNLELVDGQVRIIRGALATAMGIPANTPYDIEALPLNPPVDSVTDAVENYIQRAQAERSDLAAQRARIEQSLARIRLTRSALYPNLTLGGGLGGYIDDTTLAWENRSTTALTLNIPIFKGFSRRYDVLKARQDAEIQKAQMESLEQSVILEVWTSYFNLQTAVQRLKTADDLLKSALQSQAVALGRYQEGVGGFLDLLAAQSALETARAQQIQSQADWYIALAQLARDTGRLWPQKPEDKGGLSDIISTPSIKEPQP